MVCLEIRTPLSGIMGTLTVLSEQRERLIEEHRELVGVAKVCGEQLLGKKSNIPIIIYQPIIYFRPILF